MQLFDGCVRADVAKLVDALVLEASAERHVSSSLTVRTTKSEPISVLAALWA